MIFIKLDLHLHTKYSDGLFEPYKLIDLAVDKGMDAIAITDHDTISAIEEAQAYIKKNYQGEVELIPGIEFGCIYEKEEIHILGYFIDYKDKKLLSLIDELKASRINRSKKILKKIKDLGLELSFEEVLKETSDGFIGRPHIARAMVKKGYVEDVSDAFDKYIGMGMPAYVERFKLDVVDAVELIHLIGGTAILAHPGLLKDKANIARCIDWGIDGIECIHSEHSQAEREEFKEICRRKNLKITGGSDCHGQLIDGELLIGNYYVEVSSIEDLKV